MCPDMREKSPEEIRQAALLSYLRQHADKSDGDLFVSSLNDAQLLLKQNMHPEGAKFRRQLVDYITDPEHEVFSSCDAYHNFVMDLCRAGDHFIALKVCDFALKYAPKNRDILGDAILACTDSSQFGRGESYLRIAETIPTRYWSYRLFLYSIQFLKARLDADPGNEEIFGKALALTDDFTLCFPFDEHSHNMRAELLLLMNKRDEAINALNYAIHELQPGGVAGTSLVCAQCCVTLLNLLDDSTEYEHIIDICDFGLRHTTQEQPSARIGFFMYRKALALDAMAHREGFRVPDIVIKAMRCYQVAYDLNRDRSYASTIETRFGVLRPHAIDAGYTEPLRRRPMVADAGDS